MLSANNSDGHTGNLIHLRTLQVNFPISDCMISGHGWINNDSSWNIVENLRCYMEIKDVETSVQMEPSSVKHLHTSNVLCGFIMWLCELHKLLYACTTYPLYFKNQTNINLCFFINKNNTCVHTIQIRFIVNFIILKSIYKLISHMFSGNVLISNKLMQWKINGKRFGCHIIRTNYHLSFIRTNYRLYFIDCYYRTCTIMLLFFMYTVYRK